jgi:hypothetical protein
VKISKYGSKQELERSMESAPAAVFAFESSKTAHYFLHFFAAAKNEKKRRPAGFEYIKTRNNCNKSQKAAQTY